MLYIHLLRSEAKAATSLFDLFQEDVAEQSDGVDGHQGPDWY